MAIPDDLISPRAAARLLSCHVATIHRWIGRGKLRAWTRGENRRLLSRADVLGLLVPHVPGVQTPGRIDDGWADRVLDAAGV